MANTAADHQSRLDKAEAAAALAQAKAQQKSAAAQLVRAEIQAAGMGIRYDYDNGLGVQKVVNISGAARRKGGVRK